MRVACSPSTDVIAFLSLPRPANNTPGACAGRKPGSCSNVEHNGVEISSHDERPQDATLFIDAAWNASLRGMASKCREQVCGQGIENSATMPCLSNTATHSSVKARIRVRPSSILESPVGRIIICSTQLRDAAF